MSHSGIIFFTVLRYTPFVHSTHKCDDLLADETVNSTVLSSGNILTKLNFLEFYRPRPAAGIISIETTTAASGPGSGGRGWKWNRCCFCGFCFGFISNLTQLFQIFKYGRPMCRKKMRWSNQKVHASNFLVRSKAMALSGLLWVAFLPDEHHPIWWSALPCLV